MSAVCIMVLGTTSGAGKSWVTTGLCRHYARLGLRVTPFKAQNMSNNARVVEGMGGRYGEIGSAQYFQALAAQTRPDVRMNPLLLKPEADTHSQVVCLGEVSDHLSKMPWRKRSDQVWPQISAALDALREEYDVVVIEGAGSPAEINLHASDIVNMRVARHAQARCLLVSDIDRGGAFAHLYGTWALLPPEEQQLIHGFVLNKFRGDAALLAPAPQMLESLTQVPTVATLPMWWKHGLPEEDGVFDMSTTQGEAAVHRLTVAIITYPRISNLDEFQPLKNMPGVRLVWARTPADCAGADWIILPGSKHTTSDLSWLREQGLDLTVTHHAEQGRTVLGVCGGLQMLGEALIDTHGIDGNAPGLGLLPLVTQFEAQKAVRHTVTRFGPLVGPWAPLSGIQATGYEIHHGQTAQHPALAARGDVAREVVPALAWQNTTGNVLGLYLHGVFEDPNVLKALFGAKAPLMDSVFNGLADFLARHFQPGVLEQLLQPSPSR